MPAELLMPALSPTMEEGKLVKWLVSEGSEIRPGDVIAEIETDKVTMEIEAVDEGRIDKLLVDAGADAVKVNTPIAVIALSTDTDEEESGQPASTMTAAAEAGMITSSPEPQTPNGNGRMIVSPVARRLASEHGIDLNMLSGSGPRGRIIKRDVEAALDGGQLHAAELQKMPPRSTRPQVPPPQSNPPAHVLTPITNDEEQTKHLASADQNVAALFEEGTFELVPHDGMRKTLAERLTYAKQSIPHYYLSIDCRLDELLDARTRLNAEPTRADAPTVKLSLNDFFIKAIALALQYVPSANVTWTGEGALYHKTSDVAVAVAVEGGIFTPIVRHAHVKSLSEISSEMKELAERARARRLAPHEYLGGTTSISNLGMYGVKQFEAVINPPHASILAVGAADKRPIVNGDEIEIAAMMSFTLSCDHRVIDGAIGADLLAVFQING